MKKLPPWIGHVAVAVAVATAEEVRHSSRDEEMKATIAKQSEQIDEMNGLLREIAAKPNPEIKGLVDRWRGSRGGSVLRSR